MTPPLYVSLLLSCGGHFFPLSLGDELWQREYTVTVATEYLLRQILNLVLNLVPDEIYYTQSIV